MAGWLTTWLLLPCGAFDPGDLRSGEEAARPGPHLVSGGSLRRPFPVPSPFYAVPLDDDDGDDDDFDEDKPFCLPDAVPCVATLPPPTVTDRPAADRPPPTRTPARLLDLLQILVI